MVAAVGTCDIGDVPYRIGTGAVLECAAAKGVCETVRMLLSVTLDGVGILLHPFPVLEEGIIHKILPGLFLDSLEFRILKFQGIVRDGIQKPAAVDADSGLEADADFAHVQVDCLSVPAGLDRHIVGIGRDGHLRIYQAVSLPVRELVPPFVGIVEPADGDFLLVKRGLERGYGLGLRHTGKGSQICIRLLVIEDQQIAVAHLVITVGCRPLPVPVPRVAHQARSPEVEGAEAVERLGCRAEIVLEDQLPVLELLLQPGILDSGGRVLEGGGGNIERGAKLASRISLYADPFRNRVRYRIGGIPVHVTCGQAQGRRQ